MKIAKWAIGVALIGGLMASPAWTQGVEGQQSTVEPAYGYAEVEGSPSPQSEVQSAAYGYSVIQDEQAAPPSPTMQSPSDSTAAAMIPTRSSSRSCGGANCGACSDCCSLGDPLRLVPEIAPGIEVGGWISVGGHANEHQTALNGPLGFNNLGDGINVHQLWAYAGKEANTEGCGWDWGARMDYVYGVDGPDTQAFRGTQWDLGWTSGDYGSAIPQAYAEIAIDYLTVKAGYFYTLIGYEVVQAPQNFFYSHSYTQYYVEPFTHTGALATYDGFENWTFHGGWTTGWDTAFERVNGSDMFLGGATYSPDENVSVSYMTSVGYFGNTGRDLYMHSIVMDLNLTDRLKWVIQSDLNVQSGQGRDLAAGGVNQYLFLELSDCWSIGGRFEWLYDRDGAFVQPGAASGNYYNLTAGLNWKPHANVVFRPEVRYDWFAGTYQPGGLPFDNGQSDEQLSFGFDAIFMF